jgi:hypothetical protein
MRYDIDYETLKCDECGGTIGIYDRLVCHYLKVEYSSSKLICDRCGKEFNLYELEYDYIEANTQTGWLFPVKHIRRNVYETE